MCLCIETIRVEHGKVCHLDDHQSRFDQTRRELFPDAPPIPLHEVIPATFPDDGRYKLRLVYGRDVQQVTVERYIRRSIRLLGCVVADDIDYHRKWADRRELELLRESRPDADDIIIVRRGLVTDSSYSNLAFLGDSGWVTPSEPLLDGTARSRLVREGAMQCRPIAVSELYSFSHVSLVNALNDPGDLMLPISSVLKVE
jgi:4-amino-4-deoxychorismate lyase